MEEMQTQVKAGQEIKYVHKGNHSAIYQDAKMLRNVLHNLISNAITYAPENKQIYIYPPLKATTSTIEVQDQGIGIPEEDQPHLFTRFFRAHNTSNIQGTGLGLNIVKRYIELMGGSISFTRVANQGTTFFIDLPQNLNKTIS
jgi:signal transduction histidine kinase